VGRLQNKGLEKVFEILSTQIGNSTNALTLKELFTKAYLTHNSLTEATRSLANSLFGDHGLVIIDGDDVALKKLLVPYVKKDIFENVAFKKVTQTIADINALEKTYGVQVNPREINYFYLKDGLRERIIEKNGNFLVKDTDLLFTKTQLLEELEAHPERFSPNVIARPLYQEVILPNLCYIGGGGEIAYWLELKKSFEAMQIPFPMLLLRKAQEVKQKKGLDNLEKRLLKAQKRKLKDQVVRMTELQNALFPNQSLQERNTNFSELYLEMGEELILLLLKALKPLKTEFVVLTH